MTPREQLDLAEQLIRDAADHILIASAHCDLDASHFKAIAVRLRHEENNVHALAASLGGSDLAGDLERVLGSAPGEVCS